MDAAWQVTLDAMPAVADEFETLVREHARLAFRVAYSVLRNHHDAEDAVQETFMRALRSRTKLAGIADRRAWVARIAWRVAIDRRPAAPALAPEEMATRLDRLTAGGTAADQHVAEREMVALLEALIPTLPRDLRDVLVLSTVEEMSSAEVAAVLGIPEGSVRTRLLRARQLLRDKLAALLRGKQ